MIYKFFRFGFFCSCLFIFFSFCISSDAVEFTNAVTLGSGDTTYDHANVVANGCVLTIEGNHSFGDLTVTNAGTVVFNGTNLNLTGLQLQNSEFQMAGGATVDVVNAVSLQSSSTLLVQSVHTDAQVSNQWKGVGGTIHAGTVSVEVGSAISADAQGYAGGSGDNDPGKGPGVGRPREGSSYGAGGGGYGGAGGSYLAYVGGSAYGSSTGPLGPGSGGASDRSSNYQGGRGGGSIRLSVDGTLTLDGLISADGESRSSYYEGGGSGGAIWVTAGTLAGQGAFLARGGAASGSYTTAGGGGRIAVYYEADE
ncbi:MAG TPA: hypothetical protein VJ904_09405, partial [Tichowtungia sp.]|nr:hypothetical protein [Tichowtungia sp.]